RLEMDPAFADRYLNEGFSGGEKKRNEILQMAMLEPLMAILDETDSGLDIDALRVVAKGVNEVRTAQPEMGVLLITHYQRIVLAAMTEYYETTHANVHRGVYAMAEEATARYEAARGKVRRFINGRRDSEIVFTKNVTEAINLVSNSWGRANLREGDAILLTEI